MVRFSTVGIAPSQRFDQTCSSKEVQLQQVCWSTRGETYYIHQKTADLSMNGAIACHPFISETLKYHRYHARTRNSGYGLKSLLQRRVAVGDDSPYFRAIALQTLFRRFANGAIAKLIARLVKPHLTQGLKHFQPEHNISDIGMGLFATASVDI